LIPQFGIGNLSVMCSAVSLTVVPFAEFIFCSGCAADSALARSDHFFDLLFSDSRVQIGQFVLPLGSDHTSMRQWKRIRVNLSLLY
jgi:hypothetical protein